MNARQRKTLDSFGRAITFVGTSPPALAGAPPGFADQVQALRADLWNPGSRLPMDGRERRTHEQSLLSTPHQGRSWGRSAYPYTSL